jgi:hypothetical protein
MQNEILEEDLTLVWERDCSTVTSVRAIYMSKIKGKCSFCEKETFRIVDYLGKLEYLCEDSFNHIKHTEEETVEEKTQECKLKICKNGDILMLYYDGFPFRSIGSAKISQASFIKFNSVTQKWCISIDGKKMQQEYLTRGEAIEDEIRLLEKTIWNCGNKQN